MIEWIELIGETEQCIERIMANPMIPQEVKDRKVKIVSGRSARDKVLHPPIIRVI